MSVVARILPWVIAVLALVWLVWPLRPAPQEPGSQDLQSFAQIPVLYEGRVKPLDTFARNALLIISDRQTWRDDEGVKQPAVKWLLDVMAAPLEQRIAAEHRVFRIDHPGLLTVLGLEQRPGFRYALNEFAGRLSLLDDQTEAALAIAKEDRSLYQRRVVELYEQLNLMRQITQYRAPLVIPPGAGEGGDTWTALFDAMQAHQAISSEGPSADQDAPSPPDHPTPAQIWLSLLSAHNAGQVLDFNTIAGGMLAQVRNDRADTAQRAAVETIFNQAQPFYQAMALYVMAFVLVFLGWLFRQNWLGRSAALVIVVGMIGHTIAIVVRIYLQGRPPVTNLYSSAVFVGWATIVASMILELIYRRGLGTAVAAAVGFCTLLIAHHLAGDGDTMRRLQAVLDTNFWLATHVITITLGYAACFLAGGLGTLFILGGFFTRGLRQSESIRGLGRMIYGVVCFGLLLSFVGTVLGGIWADQSWGRFWGWDPKENGALMIVLWNALILHARWGGMVQHRGIAVLAVLGNIVTAWAWFGVNMLGVGLHSYGFMDSAVFWMLLFVASQLTIAGIGMLPISLWVSFAAESAQRRRSVAGQPSAREQAMAIRRQRGGA